MAKLQFDVTAKWQEVEKLRKEVEALKAALKDFNVSGDMKGFDEMNKKYAEATGKLKEYEQQMQKYQQIIEQMKLSTGIVDDSKRITAELNNATDVFVEQRVKVKALESDIRKLQNEYNKLSEVQRNSIRGEILLNEIKEMGSLYRQQNEVLKQLKKSYTDNIKVEGAAADSLVALRQQLRQLTAEYDRLSQADREATLGNNLLKQIQELHAQISVAEQATGRFQRNVGNYASAWNGLGMSVQQVARELPAMAMGFNTFFLAISNNLPMLVDEFKRATEEYKNFKKEMAAGNTNVQRVVSPWKQLLSSILSWQTALVVGITVLSMYGDEIIDWVSNLFGADTAQKRLNESLKEFNSLAGKGQAEAKLLFDAVERTEEGTQGRANAIREINKAYGEYLPYLLSEQASLKELEAAYKTVNKSLRENAAMKAQTKAINEVLEKSIDKQANALNEMRAIASERLGGDNFANEIITTVEGLTEDFRLAGDSWEEAWRGVSAKIQSEVGATKLPRGFSSSLEDYVKSVYDSNQQIANIQKKFNPFFNKEQADKAIIENKQHYETMKSQAESYLNSIAADQKKLLDAGNFGGIDEETVRKYKEAKANIQEASKQLKVYDSYDKQSKAAEKQAKEQKKIQKKVNNELLELQRRNQQSQIDLMEEGAEKKLAQIELEYDRTIDEIRKREQELRDEQGGQLTVEQSVEIKRAEKVAEQQKEQATQQVKTDEFEAERKAMNDYLLEYGTFQQKKMALAVKYSNLIAEASTEGEKLSLGKEWDKELSDLEIKAGDTSNAIIALFGDMSNKSLKELETLASKGQEALDFIKNGQWDATTGARLGITEDEFRRWQESPEVIKQAGDALKEVKGQADELQPSFVKVRQGLEQFFNSGNDAKKLQEALNLINEGVNEIMSSVGFLSDTFSKLGESFGGVFSGIADGLNIAMDAVNSAMQGAQAGAMFGGIGAAAGAAVGVVTSLASAIAKIHDKKNEKRIQKLQDQIDVLDASYENLGRSLEKAYSTDASKLIDQQNKLLEQQKLLIQQQILEEQDKKKTDDDRIKQWQQQIEDIDNQIKDNAEQAQEAIAGISFDTFRSNFLDTLTDMDSSAEDFANDFESYLQRSILDSLMANKYDEKIKQLYNQWTQLGDNGLTESEVERLKKEQQAIVEQMIQDRDQLAEIFGWKNELEESAASSQQASAGGFENMSQDSADELNGRFTALQMIGEEMLLFFQSSEQFMSLLYIKASMDVITVQIAAIYDVANETRTMMANIYIEIQQINENTNNTVVQLKEAVKKLTSIETNTGRI